jgi:hypothetical protein
MKTCSYCGTQYPDDAAECPIDHTPAAVAPVEAATDAPKTDFQFSPLSPEERNLDLVTLLTCPNLTTADLMVCRLRAAEFEAFIPDEFLMQSAGLVNTFGYVRVQVAPRDYDAARAFLSESDED